LLACLGLCMSLLCALSALCAWCIRWLDHENCRVVLNACGVDDDLWIYFTPCLVLVFLVAVCRWLIGNCILKTGWSSLYSLIEPLMLFGIYVFGLSGFALLLSTSDIDFVAKSLIFGDKPEGQPRKFDWLNSYLVPLVLAGLLPYLKPHRLFRSGLHPSGLRDQITVQIVTVASLIGLPLLVVTYFAREDISGHNNARNGRFVESDISSTIGWEKNCPQWQALIAFQKKVSKEFSDPVKPSTMWSCSDIKWFKDSEEKNPGQSFDLEVILKRIENTDLEVDKLQKNKPWNLRDIAKLNSEARRYRKHAVNILNCTLVLNPHLTEHLNEPHDAQQERRQHSEFRYLLDQWMRSLPTDKTNASQSKPETHRKEMKRRLAAAKLAVQDFIKAEKEISEAVDTPSISLGPQLGEYCDRLSERNRKLIAGLFGFPEDGKKILGPTAVLEKDQSWRLKAVFYSLLAACVLSCVNLNATSIHGFYETCLKEAWIQPVLGTEQREPLLTDLKTWPEGTPYPLLTAAAYLSTSPGRPLVDHDAGPVQGERIHSVPEEFLFSPLYCGAESTKYCKTEEYMNGEVSLSNALAISGDAVSPLRQNQLLLRFGFFAFNVRLGQWMDTPNGGKTMWRWFLPWSSGYTPGAYVLWRWCRVELCNRNPKDFPRCFVMDGGAQENLGIRALLRRRCKVILACDASCDQEYVFEDLAHLVLSTRIRDGIRLESVRGFEWERLRPRDASTKMKPLVSKQNRVVEEGGDEVESEEEGSEAAGSRPGSTAHFAVFKIEYPEDKKDPAANRWGVLLYFKCSRTDDEPLDLRTYAQLHGEFPHESTADQFYSPEQFESYRQLGFHLVNSVFSKDSNVAAATDDSSLRELLHDLAPGYAKSVLEKFCLPKTPDKQHQSSQSGRSPA